MSKGRKEDNSKTWRQHYAPIIWKTICEHIKNHPECSFAKIRQELFKINPGVYSWQRRTWTSEVTGQCTHFAEITNKKTPAPGHQVPMFGYEEEINAYKGNDTSN
jgi:hypothetical protein